MAPVDVLRATEHRPGSVAGCSLVDGGMSAAAETTDAPAGARSPSPTAGEPAGPPTSGSAPPLPTARTSSANGGRASSASSDDVAMPAEGGDAEPLRVCVDSRERLRWSPALHQCFVDAVNALGGSAFAKPKDIVAKMAVPGLTLAHVKSHLQKYRAAEGVTFVPHSMRGSAGAVRRLQQHLAKQQRQTAGSSEAESMELPPAKRACIIPSAFNAAQPALPSSSWATAPAPAAAADTLQSYLSAISTALPPPLPELQPSVQLLLPRPAAAAAPPAPAANEQEEAASALLVLAELASSQHDEMHAERSRAEEQVASLGGLGEQLAAAVETAPAAAPAAAEQAEQPGLHAQLAALQAQQAALKARLEQHLQQGATLSEEVDAVWRRASELLSHPQLGAHAVTPAQLRVRQQLKQAVAAAALQQSQQPSLSSLVSLFTSLAASQQGPSPSAPAPVGGSAPPLLHLLQLQCAQQAQAQQ